MLVLHRPGSRRPALPSLCSVLGTYFVASCLTLFLFKCMCSSAHRPHFCLPDFTSLEWQRVSTDTKCRRDKSVSFVKGCNATGNWMWQCPVMPAAGWRSGGMPWPPFPGGLGKLPRCATQGRSGASAERPCVPLRCPSPEPYRGPYRRTARGPGCGVWCARGVLFGSG